MNDLTLEQYKQRVNQLGQQLLDVISSVTVGDLDVKVDIPDDIEVLADLGVGLQFMIEDLQELAQDQERTRQELELRVAQRTREMEAALRELQNTQRQMVREGWEEYAQSKEYASGFVREGNEEKPDDGAWLPTMTNAVQRATTIVHENGSEEQSLAVPIQLQDEIIGVLGFDRKHDQPWDKNKIATVEAIVEQVGLALENQRLFDQTQSALAETDLLYKASAELNTAQNYDDILSVLSHYTLLGQDSSEIALAYFDRPWTKLQRPDWVNLVARWTAAETPLEPDAGFSMESTVYANSGFQPDQPILFEDTVTDERLDEITRENFQSQHQAQSAIYLPMVVGGRWVGYISAFYAVSTSFPEENVRRAMAISAQASVALQNLRSIELAEQRAQEAQKRSEELALINRVVASVSASFDLRQGLEIVATELTRALSVEDVAIALIDEDRSELTTIADSAKMTGTPTAVGLRVPISESPIIQQLINTMKPVILTADENVDLKPEQVLEVIMKESGFDRLVVLPLIAANEVIGTVTLALSQANELSDDEMRLAETIVFQAATSIQNARLFEQTQTALTATADLYQASAELNTAQSFPDILATLRRHTILGQNSRFVSMYVFDKPWETSAVPEAAKVPESLIPLAQWTRMVQTGLDDQPLSLAKWTTVDQIFKSDEISIIQDLSGDPRMDSTTQALFMGKLGANTVVCAPLVSSGQWIGEIIATYQDLVNFGDSAIRRLMALAAQAAVAIQAIRLLEETTRRASQLETAAEIARDSSGNLEVDSLLNRAVHLINDRFGFYHASIFLLEGTNATVKASTRQELVDMQHTLPMREGGSIIGQVTFSGEPLMVNDVATDPTHRPHPLLPDTRAEMGIPLVIGSRVTGALDVQSTEVNAFSEDDVAVLRILADQIAVALDNARSFEVAQQAMEEIREADRLKTQFLANMSHELRTPLNSIIGFSRVILKGIDGPINDVQQEDLQAIHASGQHLLRMINDILDLSKIEAGKMELSIEEVDIGEIIKSALSTATGLVKEKPIQLRKNVPEELPVVNADSTRIRQVLINLLQNAAKFTDEGTISLEARLQAGPEGGEELWIGVTDTGIGIAADDQKKLFEPFSQVDDSPTRKTGGTGLGLSISRRMVEMQGGQIGLDSEVGEGSTFWFTLPVTKAMPVEVSVAEEEVAEDKRIVLAIDDDEKIISLYERYLGPHGYHIVALTDPTVALQEAKKIKPAAITLDIMMPSKDGWQVIQELKSDPDTKDIPIIICSIVTDREKGFSLGATDYLVKPILEDELVRALSRLNLNGGKEVHEVLVVDDQEEAYRLVDKALSQHKKYKTSFAEGGLQGLAAIQTKRPDVVILDLFMPDMDGFTLLENMRSDSGMYDIPVIILTGADLSEADQERLRGFEQSLLTKSALNEEELLTSLHQAIKKFEKTSQ
ncbi:MAG: GAF domain-containing protein [Anaerolineales bacterium]|nr:GAF domain-containing protein [Anaerolineales bacterium]